MEKLVDVGLFTMLTVLSILGCVMMLWMAWYYMQIAVPFFLKYDVFNYIYCNKLCILLLLTFFFSLHNRMAFGSALGAASSSPFLLWW